VQDSLIKILGRWESAAYTLSIRTPPEVFCGVAATMVVDRCSEGTSEWERSVNYSVGKIILCSSMKLSYLRTQTRELGEGHHQ